MVYSCWSCGSSFENKEKLRNHYMSKPHRFLEVVCAWCSTKLRRPVDLRHHISTKHKQVTKRFGSFPSDLEAFFAAMEPRAYRTCVKGLPVESDGVSVMKELLLSWSVRSVEEWEHGWDRHGPTSSLMYDASNGPERETYSPTKPSLWTIQTIEVGPISSKVIVFGGKGAFHRLTVDSKSSRTRDKLMRVMTSLPDIPHALPKQWMSDHMSSTTLHRMLKAVGLDGTVITKSEVCRWEPEDHQKALPPKRRSISPLSLSPFPLPPILSPLHEPELDFDFAETELSEHQLPATCLSYLLDDTPSTAVSTCVFPTTASTRSLSPVLTSSATESGYSSPAPLVSSLAQPSNTPTTVSADTPTIVSTVIESACPFSSSVTMSAVTTSTITSTFTSTVPACSLSSYLVATSCTDISPSVISTTTGSISHTHVVSSASTTGKKSDVISSMDSSAAVYLPTLPLTKPAESIMKPTPLEDEMFTGHPIPKDTDSCYLPKEDMANLLLTSGVMPLLPPARRNWESTSSVTIPLQDPLNIWPPADWKSMSPDNKLLLWQTVATSLGVQWGLPLDRHFILDAFQFLALPGTKDYDITSPEALLRHANFTVVRNIAKKKHVVGADTLVSIYEAGYPNSFSAQPGPYRDFLQSLNHIPTRI